MGIEEKAVPIRSDIPEQEELLRASMQGGGWAETGTHSLHLQEGKEMLSYKHGVLLWTALCPHPRNSHAEALTRI